MLNSFKSFELITEIIMSQNTDHVDFKAELNAQNMPVTDDDVGRRQPGDTQ